MTIAAKFLEIQEQLNQKLAVDWATKGWAYPDAMFTEATEAFNHLNWEWWRAADRAIDWDQVKLEWIDVCHFLISEVIAQKREAVFTTAFNRAHEMYKKEGFVSEEYNLAAIKNGIRRFINQITFYSIEQDGKETLSDVIQCFLNVAWRLKLHPEALFSLFVSKVCLNQLRWKNGYKKGVNTAGKAGDPVHYIKTWDGEEDNVWLANAAGNMNSAHPDFKADLERILDGKYKQVYEAVWNK